MNPFAAFQAGSKPLAARLAARSGLVLFVLCLVLCLSAVVWRARARADAGRVHARTAAQARATALELQLSQAVSAAEVLGALARQSGGGISNFQTVALELLASRPGLASLELQPGGVVSDIVPRAGHERAIGFNVLKDAAHRPGAYAAIQKRVLTVTGPLTLYHGEAGIVVRVPVFQRGRDGRDYFWGFVAVSMGLPEALARARVDELATQGYNYAFFAPASAQQKSITIAARGALAFQDAVQEPVRAQNLEFRLAVRPRSGWVNAPKVALESLGVLVISGLLCLLANLLERRQAYETAERKQTQKDRRGAKDSAAAAQAESTLAELQERLARTVRLASETSEIAQNKLKQAELSARELQARLDATARAAEEAAQAKQAELEQARLALAQAQQAISELQARLEAAASAESKTAADALARLQDQAPIADLTARLDAAKRSEREAAEASAARLKQAEKGNRVLAGRLLKAEARVIELSALLQKTQADLKRLQNDSAGSAGVRTAAPVVLAAPVEQTSATEIAPVPSLFERQLEASQTPAKPAPNARAIGSAEDSTRPALELASTSAALAPQELETSARGPLSQITAQPQSEPLAVEAGLENHSATTAALPDLPERAVRDLVADLKPVLKPEEGKPAPARRLPTPPPVNPAQLRKAVNEILPLLADQDPGAKDCLKANRATLRSAFPSKAYEEFEQLVKRGEFAVALDQLKKATKKHGVSL
ncbi:exported hypothetical protein [Verrucomicrobia bacterium]|nr:exported hypothetical protein [Verrucomicrobiota bacterium]